MRSQQAASIVERTRGICLALPEAVEHVDGFGHTTFQIGGNSFVRLSGDEAAVNLAFKSDKETQQLLLQEEHFFQTPYIGRHGWVSIRNPREEHWEELAELIEGAYLRAAPRRLVKAWMERRAK